MFYISPECNLWLVISLIQRVRLVLRSQIRNITTTHEGALRDSLLETALIIRQHATIFKHAACSRPCNVTTKCTNNIKLKEYLHFYSVFIFLFTSTWDNRFFENRCCFCLNHYLHSYYSFKYSNTI